MKSKLKELDVDFIGGQGPLTKEEELAISEFIKNSKEKRKQKELRGKQKGKKKFQQPA